MLSPSEILTYVPKWPLELNLIGAFACLSLSSYYHTCRCVSESTFDNLLCLDKSGISLLIAGSTAPFNTYLYACAGVQTARHSMQLLVWVMCALTFAFSLKKDMSNTALAVLFVIMGLAAPAPFYLSPFFDDS